MNSPYIYIIFLIFLLAISTSTQAVHPVNISQTLLSQDTSYPKDNVKAQLLADGATIVLVWQSNGQDGDGWGIYARHFDSLGVPGGAEFQVNTETTNDQKNPSICARPNGGYAIVWESILQQASTDGIYLQMYDNAHNPVGGETVLANATTNQHNPSVGCFSDNGFVVTFDSDGQEWSDLTGIFARVFDSAASQIGSEIHVNDYVASYQTRPDVTVNTNDDFMIVFETDGNNGAGYDIYFRKFNQAGAPQTGQLHINSGDWHSFTQDQFKPKIQPLTSGDLAVVWQDEEDQDSSEKGVFYRVVDGNGGGSYEKGIVSSYVLGDQIDPTIIVSDDGVFGVVWASSKADTYDKILLQRFQNNGDRFGFELLISEDLSADLSKPCGVFFSSNSDAWIVWIEDSTSIVGKSFEFGEQYQECSIDSDCVSFNGRPYCNPDGYCSECLVDSNCDSNDNGNICSPELLVCKPCLNGEDFLPNGECSTCDPSCETCNGPYDNHCLSCAEDKYFLQEDQECIDSCPSPEFIIKEGNICETDPAFSNPCDSGQFFNSGSSKCENCYNGCLECEGPDSTDCISCELTFKFIPESSSCEECPPGYIYEQDVGDCVELEVNEECSSKQYFNTTVQGDCLNECNFPLEVEEISIYKVCKKPCPMSGPKYFNTDTEECQAKCDSYRTKNGVLICQDHLQNVRKSAQQASDSQQVANSVGTMSAVSSSRGPNSLILILISKFLVNLRYIDIDFPENLHAFYINYEDTEIQSGMEPPENFEGDMQVPSSFAMYEVSSGFLFNYWSTLMILLIFLVLAVVAAILFKYFAQSNKEELTSILKELKIMLKWNLFLMLFCSNIDEIYLYSYLEFGATGKTNKMAVRSFGILLAIVMLVLSIGILAQTCFVIYKFHKMRKQVRNGSLSNKELESYKEKWQTHKVLFLAFKTNKLTTQGYMIIFLVRAILFIFIIAFGGSNPIAQTTLILLLNIAMLIFTAIKRPCIDLMNNIELIVYELIQIVANTSIFVLSIMDEKNDQNRDARESLGQAIITCFILFAASSLFFVFVHLAIGIYGVIKKMKEKKKKEGKLTCMSLLTIPFEAAGMSLEEQHEKYPGPSAKVIHMDKSKDVKQKESFSFIPKSRNHAKVTPVFVKSDVNNKNTLKLKDNGKVSMDGYLPSDIFQSNKDDIENDKSLIQKSGYDLASPKSPQRLLADSIMEDQFSINTSKSPGGKQTFKLKSYIDDTKPKVNFNFKRDEPKQSIFLSVDTSVNYTAQSLQKMTTQKPMKPKIGPKSQVLESSPLQKENSNLFGSKRTTEKDNNLSDLPYLTKTTKTLEIDELSDE